MKQQLLLLKDVFGLGVKGQLVFAKPGYIRNFLIPQGCAVIATENMKRRQKSLELAQAEQAIKDKKDSEILAAKIEAISLETYVKVDPMGRMHGSVRPLDIAQLFIVQGIELERNNIVLNKPIKETGAHKIPLNLKGGIQVTCTLHIIPEGGVSVTEVAPIVAAISAEDAQGDQDAE